MVKLWLARMSDLKGIMEVEKECFGSISGDAMASVQVMRHRIELCNHGTNKWFWVAGENKILGYVISQPTHLTPDECISWDVATDGGTLKRTFDNLGDNIFGISLATRAGAPSGTSELLIHASFTEWAAREKRFLMFCSRMPGFLVAQKKTGISAEEYWHLRRYDGSPKDSMLRFYWEITGGVQPHRLLKNGFPPDVASGGHGVLFVAKDVGQGLRALADKIYRAGIKTVQKTPREGGAHGYHNK